jgi:CubicO group peptidase (beta-lactamase class C family)
MNTMTIRRDAAIAALCAMLARAGGTALAEERPAAWPTRGWATATPAAYGLRAEALEAFAQELAGDAHGYVDGMLVVRHGAVVFERTFPRDYDAPFASAPDRTRGPYNYYDPDWHPYYRRGPLHTMQSVTKSVTSALVGIALRRGEIASVEAPVLDFFAGYRMPREPRWRRMRLRDLLTMTAGIAWDEEKVPYTDPANDCAQMEKSADWVRFVLDKPMAAEPGRVFVYNSGATQLLSQVLRLATGQHADAYAARHLFGPLGIRDFHWKRTPSGHPDTEGGLYLAPRDLARLGLLYARDGLWEGRRLLPPGWVEASTAPLARTAADANALRYGYQWWVLPDPEAAGGRRYAALGYGGQRLLVVPALDLVAVFTGWNIYDKPALSPALALRRVLEAVEAQP